MLSVTLATGDYRYAMNTAYVRNERAIRSGRRSKNKSDRARDLGIHEIGCCGELIAMNALGIPNPMLSIDGFRSEPDIPPGACEAFPHGAEVRTRVAVPDAPYPIDLIVRADDDPQLPVILVLVEPAAPASGLVVGWIKALDAMNRSEWYKNPGGKGDAWFVPQGELHTLERVGVVA